MKVIEVTLNNYKSIGNNMSKLLVEDKITTIIGKNESGKSNILEALAGAKMKSIINSNYFNNSNRITNEEIDVCIGLKFTEEEKNIVGNINESTFFYFIKEKPQYFEGGLSIVINEDKELEEAINNLENIINENKLNFDSSKIDFCKKYIKNLRELSCKIYYQYNEDLQKIIIWSKDSEFKCNDVLIKIINLITKYYALIPEIYYTKGNEQLKNIYTVQEIVDIIKNKKDIFYRFIQAAKISEAEMLKSFQETNVGEKEDIRDEIKRKIRENIEEKFNEFYKQEKVELKFSYDTNSVRIFIKTSNKTMNLSERSNGLRWYFNLFIDVLSQINFDTPIIYLFDEPGVYLHVNAQKELLNLFEDLANKNNQIIYTTHSPYMVNKNDFVRVRAVQKDSLEITKIYNNVYDSRLDKKSKKETLSPYLESIGMDFDININSAKRNVITEGITDYMYIKAMLKYLEVKDETYIIPSAGVDKINRIASILLGWGLDFKVVVDYDTQGKNEYKKLVNNLELNVENQVAFVNCKDFINHIKTENYETIESLISEDDYNKLTNRYNKDDEEGTKTISAREFYDKVMNNNIKLEELTIENFKKLFTKLQLI